jgi:hypothetical protein
MGVVWFLGAVAIAGPSASPPGTSSEPEIVVVPSVVEGAVKLVFAGREGDLVYIDGWKAGALPLETTLAGGIHHFRIDGETSRVELDLNVEVVPGQVVVVDLAPPPPPPPQQPPATPPKTP